MSLDPNYPPSESAAPPPPYLTSGPVVRRYALGLPAGSVRAILSLLVVGLLCALILLSTPEREIPLPAYLLYLLFLVVGHYFAAHGNSIHRAGSGQPPPLYLPSGFVRFFILGLLVATVAWKLSQGSEILEKQLNESFKEIQQQPYLPLILLGGFFLGVLVHLLLGRQYTPYWLEDLEAWVALIAVIGLCVDAMITLVINPTLKDPLKTYELQAFVAALIAWYFGARS